MQIRTIRVEAPLTIVLIVVSLTQFIQPTSGAGAGVIICQGDGTDTDESKWKTPDVKLDICI
jgi:hypothetical protein